MKDGFLRVAAVTPKLIVADVDHNVKQIKKQIKKCTAEGAKIIVFPELCITGYTCGDLFMQSTLLDNAIDGLFKIVKASKKHDALIFVGLPISLGGKLYNVAAAVCKGEILGLVPKTNIPTYGEFYEGRYFAEGPVITTYINPWGARFGADESEEYWCEFGANQIFRCNTMDNVAVACEICEDLWVGDPPSSRHARAGADIIVNLSASDELVGKSDYRRNLIMTQSARLYTAYVYASAGTCESTQDVVYSGHRLICENGRLLAEGRRFTEGITMCDIDTESCMRRRVQTSTYKSAYQDDVSDDYVETEFTLRRTTLKLMRDIDPHPFVPDNEATLKDRCEEILNIQASGLAKRLAHTHSAKAVVGISGGLDSTLALLVTAKSFDILGLDRGGIIGITMPGFGTTDRTYDNACSMVRSLGATLREISIAGSVRRHFDDIGQDENVHDVTYENSQARMRTMILMDVANKEGALVVGTGDLSELALGWATYNGDHMSMYGVNASVPKTLVRHLVRYYADHVAGPDSKLGKVLYDVLDTPVSPELLPPEEGDISQKTEELVGPYELHDFFLYYVLRYGFTPHKIFRLAKYAFAKQYEDTVILSWMKTFYRRFFAQQFKRSCLPDGPKVGTVALSPRGDWRMPSDASASIWMKDLEEIKVG